MRLIDASTYECSLCGDVFTVPAGSEPQDLILTNSQARPERVIFVRGSIYHRCPINRPVPHTDQPG